MVMLNKFLERDRRTRRETFDPEDRRQARKLLDEGAEPEEVVVILGTEGMGSLDAPRIEAALAGAITRPNAEKLDHYRTVFTDEIPDLSSLNPEQALIHQEEEEEG